MFHFVTDAAAMFAVNLIQLLLGSFLARFVPWRRIAARLDVRRGDAGARKARTGAGAPISAAAAICGAALPLGAFGCAPLASAALGGGLGADLVIPFLCSNLIFNSLVPFTDPTFIWATGYGRVVLAVAAGTIGGLLAGRSRNAGRALFRDRPLPAPRGGRHAIGAVSADAVSTLRETWAYVAVGTLAATAFRGYGLRSLMAFLFTNPYTSFLPEFFAQANVTNPLFLLATRLLMTLVNFAALAALALALKVRGIFAYLAYFAVLTAAFGLTVFYRSAT